MLIEAVLNGHTECVRLLVENGADTEFKCMVRYMLCFLPCLCMSVARSHGLHVCIYVCMFIAFVFTRIDISSVLNSALCYVRFIHVFSFKF